MNSTRSIRAFALALALAGGSVACRPPTAVAPMYEGAGAPVADKDLPLAAAHYVFSRAGTPGRTDLARPLADRLLVRSRALFSSGRERAGLAAVRLAAMLVRVNKVAPEQLSNEAIAALDPAVAGPASRGEEGPAIGMYLFWSVARPADPNPKAHLDALAKWTGSPADFPPSSLVSVGREAVRRTEALAFAPSDVDRPAADKALFEWMEHVISFKEGERTPARYGDEVYAAVLGYRTAGVRLVVGHLRDGDMSGAIEAISTPQTQGFVPEALRRSLLDAGSVPSVEAYEQVIVSLLGNAKLESMEDGIADAVLGTALAATSEHPHAHTIAELVARGLYMAGSGDAAPAVLARALLGTRDDPRRPPAKDLGRALSISAASIRDYADREDYESVRRTFAASEPMLIAADSIGGVVPSSALVKTLMGLVEGEAGRPAVARKHFDAALETEPMATAFAGRARLEAREGNFTAARASIDSALAAKGTDNEPALQADLAMLAGDFARRAGDVTAARGAYERALRNLAPLRASAKGSAAAEIGARLVSVLSHFDGAEGREDDAAAFAESEGASDSRAIVRLSVARFARPLRTQNASTAKALFRRVVALGLPMEDQVRAAVVARAIGKRVGLADDGDITKVLTTAASKDDAAGRLARFALGQLDAATLLAKAPSPRRAVTARFVIAMQAWAQGGLEAAKKDLEAVAHAEAIGTIESDLAWDLIDPTHASIPGAPAI